MWCGLYQESQAGCHCYNVMRSESVTRKENEGGREGGKGVYRSMSFPDKPSCAHGVKRMGSASSFSRSRSAGDRKEARCIDGANACATFMLSFLKWNEGGRRLKN